MPGISRSKAAVASAVAVGLVGACSEPPTAPTPIEFEFELPRIEFALIDDTASARGSLLDSLTIVVPDSTTTSGSYDLWSPGDVADYALIEILSGIELDNRPIPAAELLPSPDPIVYYRSDGELVFRAFQTEFFALPPAGGEVFQSVSSGQSGDSVVVLDTDGADHGMRVNWFMGEEEELDYNAITDGDPPACALIISFTCYPPPAFDTPNTSDTPPAGTITFRAFRGPAEPGSFSLMLSADTTELHPWIDSTTFGTPDTLFVQDDRVGDSVSVTVTATVGGTPTPGASVVVTAELVPGAGGHSHQADRIAFGDLPTFSYAAGGPRPIAGFFKQGSTRSDSIVATTDSLGQVAFRFIAGFLGGRVDLVVNASLGGAPVADTVELTIRVPGLVDLVTQGSLADSVYFIGPKEPHRSDSTWYAQPAFASALRALVSQLSRPAASQYLRLNDASLPMGGSFSTESNLFEVSAGNEVDRPGVSHRSHAYGVDIDVSVCFSDTSGKQTGFINPSCGASGVPTRRMYDIALSAGLVALLEDDPPHFHLRLGSETLRVPQ